MAGIRTKNRKGIPQPHTKRLRPGSLYMRAAEAGASLRHVARDTELALGTILRANDGYPIGVKTQLRLGIWLVQHPPLDAEMNALGELGME